MLPDRVHNRITIEALHHVVLFDTSISLASLRDLLDFFIQTHPKMDGEIEQRENNVFYEEYQIQIIDAILERLLKEGKNEEIKEKYGLIKRVVGEEKYGLIK